MVVAKMIVKGLRVSEALTTVDPETFEASRVGGRGEFGVILVAGGRGRGSVGKFLRRRSGGRGHGVIWQGEKGDGVLRHDDVLWRKIMPSLRP